MFILGAALGPIIGGAVSALGAYATGKSQQRFSRRMSGSAHQREIRDLRLAGLNPILSATGGAGASTPTPNIPHIGREAASAAAAYQQLKQLKKVQKQQQGLLIEQQETERTKQQMNWMTSLNLGKLQQLNQYKSEAARLGLAKSGVQFSIFDAMSKMNFKTPGYLKNWRKWTAHDRQPSSARQIKKEGFQGWWDAYKRSYNLKGN